jgi:hypothetical protein
VLALRDAIEEAIHGASRRSVRGSVQPSEAFAGRPSSEGVPLVVGDDVVDEPTDVIDDPTDG